MEKPFVSIVIPTYNSGLTIGDSLEGCLLQDYPKDRIEIIVVDDGSKDGTENIVKKFQVRYIYQEKKGPASARNNGWRNCKAEAVCFIDADCIPYSNWVSLLVQHLDKNNVAGVAGSYDVSGSRYLLDRFVHYEIRKRHSKMPQYINSFGTYNVLIKRSILQELGGFDISYSHASGEDSDLSYRIIRAGYKIYFEKDAMVSHRNILRFFKYMSIQFRHGYWRMRLYKKHSPMIAKDQYGHWKDFAEIFLVTALFLCFLRNPAVTLSLIVLVFAIQLPLCINGAVEQKDIRYFLFSFITFFRAFVRVIGGIIGFVRFWLFR